MPLDLMVSENCTLSDVSIVGLNFNEVGEEADVEANVEAELVSLKDDRNEETVLNRHVEVVFAIDVEDTTKDEDKPLATEVAFGSHKVMPHCIIKYCSKILGCINYFR
jgi:hypothetical protein